MLRLSAIALALIFTTEFLVTLVGPSNEGRALAVPIQDDRQSDNKQITTDVQATLDAQVAAWNKGDIPGFMAGYVNTEELRFASGNSIITGWKTTLERYQKRYSDRQLMGTLAFRNITITPLSDEYTEVFGEFHLARDSDTGDMEGLFTLLMKNTEKGWLVLHDHTSSAGE